MLLRSLLMTTAFLLPGVASAQEVRFGKGVPPVGTVIDIDQSWSATATVDVTAGEEVLATGSSLKMKTTVTGRIEVVEASKKGITKVKVRYLDAGQRYSFSGVSSSDSLEVAGHTYLATISKGEATVTLADGSPAGEEARAQVLEDLGYLLDPMAAVVPATVNVGQELDTFATWASEELADEDMQLTSSSMVLKGVDGDRAQFAITASLDGTNSELAMDTQLEGELILDIGTRRLLELKLKGPMQVEMVEEVPDMPGLAVTGQGEGSLVMAYSYPPSKHPPSMGPQPLVGLIAQAHEAATAAELEQWSKESKERLNFLNMALASGTGDKQTIMTELGLVYLREGLDLHLRGEDASERFIAKGNKMLELVQGNYPDNKGVFSIHSALWLGAMLQGDTEAAWTHAMAAGEASKTPEEGAIVALLKGEILAAQGNTDEALASYRSARDQPSPVAAVLAVRAVTVKGKGKVKLAKLPAASGEAPGWLFDLDQKLRAGTLQGELTK